METMGMFLTFCPLVTHMTKTESSQLDFVKAKMSFCDRKTIHLDTQIGKLYLKTHVSTY